jgi:hypothetical protein
MQSLSSRIACYALLTRGWHESCCTHGMLAHPRATWNELKRLPAGHRFEMHYEREHSAKRKVSPLELVAHWAAVIVCVAIGIVLVFIPGPAVVFFALAAALAAAHSRTAARALDVIEVKIRAAARAAKRAMKRH